MRANINGFEIEGTPEEVAEFIRGDYRKTDLVERRAVVNHKKHAVKVPKPRRTGFRARKWTAEEEVFIRDKYAELGPRKVARALHRTAGAVKVHACGMGVKSGKYHKKKTFKKGMRDWTQEELNELQRAKHLITNRAMRRGTIREFAKRFNRTEKAVTIRCNMLGLTLYSQRK